MAKLGRYLAKLERERGYKYSKGDWCRLAREMGGKVKEK